MKAKPHQITKSQEVLSVIREYNIAYLSGEVRTGKTLTSILVAEELEDVNTVLIITKKTAIPGWDKFKEFMKKDYTIFNYGSEHKIIDRYDLVIVDEAHNLAKVGKPSKRIKELRRVASHSKVLLLSGTMKAETINGIYHQMCITKYSPFNEFKSFRKFWLVYGTPDEVWTPSGLKETYKKAKSTLQPKIDPYLITMSQDEAGIKNRSQDKLHYVELSQETKELYNKLLAYNIATIDGEEIICDSVMKLRMTLHQLETGMEKVEYIKENFNGSIAIMSHFIKERKFLEEHLPYCEILSSNRFAEGVDLSHFDHFIIVSSDYSGAKFIQRTQRNVNMNNDKDAIVHHILVKGAISDQVYKTVSAKRDYNNSVFQRIKL